MIIMEKNKTFYVLSPGGCSRRALDTEKIINYLKLNSYLPAKNISQADLIYISTCGYDTDMEDFGVKAIEKVLKIADKNSKIVIGGCLPKINKKRLLKLGNFETISPRSIDKLDSIIDPKTKFKSVKDSNILNKPKRHHRHYVNLFKIFKYKIGFPFFLCKKFFFVAHSRHYKDKIYFIKVSEGCLGNCSYCAIKYSIGKLKSKPIDKIIDEFESGLEKDYRIFKLTSDDIGGYGIDIGTNIIELLKKIFEHKGHYSIIIHNFNPNFLIKYYDELLPIIKENHEKVGHIDIPIQSGSDKILKLMKRPYKIKRVEKCLLNSKESVKGLKITTQIMVGFPSESKEDFEKTVDLIKRVRFYDITISKYSDRPRTKSSKMRNKISEKIKIWRAFKLRTYHKIQTLSTYF